MTEPRIDLLYSQEEITRRVLELGDQIHSDLEEPYPLLLGLLSGSVVFVADLVRAIDLPLRFEFIKVDYDAHPGPDGLLEIQFPIPTEIHGERLLIVKDVTKSGIIETYLRNQFFELGARQVRFISVIDLPNERKTALSIDYKAFSHETAETFVGYGLKHQGGFGHLPYLATLDREET